MDVRTTIMSLAALKQYRCGPAVAPLVERSSTYQLTQGSLPGLRSSLHVEISLGKILTTDTEPQIAPDASVCECADAHNEQVA